MLSVLRGAVLAAALIPCAATALAQSSSPAASPAVDRSSPEALFESTTKAMQRADWVAIAQTMEPSALEAMKSKLLRLAAADPTGEAATAFFGTAELEQLGALPAVELFGRFMRSATGFVPQLNAFTAASRSSLLGSVREGDLLHLVYRSTYAFGSDEVSSVEVMTVTKHGNAWYTTLHGDFEPIVQAFLDQVEETAPPNGEPSGRRE